MIPTLHVLSVAMVPFSFFQFFLCWVKVWIGITGCYLLLFVTHQYHDLCQSTKLLTDLKSNKYYQSSQKDHIMSISPCSTKRKQLIRAYVYDKAYVKFHTRKHMEI